MPFIEAAPPRGLAGPGLQLPECRGARGGRPDWASRARGRWREAAPRGPKCPAGTGERGPGNAVLGKAERGGQSPAAPLNRHRAGHAAAPLTQGRGADPGAAAEENAGDASTPGPGQLPSVTPYAAVSGAAFISAFGISEKYPQRRSSEYNL